MKNRWLVPLWIFLLGSACDGKEMNSPNFDFSTDRCTLSQNFSAQDPDEDTADISDIQTARAEVATTDCPVDLQNASVVRGAEGTIGIQQIELSGTINLVLSLGDISPFMVPIEALTGERSTAEFLLITPLHIEEEQNCTIDATFAGTIDSVTAKIQGTLNATVHRVSKCLTD